MIRRPRWVSQAGLIPVPGTCAHQRTPLQSHTHPTGLRRKSAWATVTGSPQATETPQTGSAALCFPGVPAPSEMTSRSSSRSPGSFQRNKGMGKGTWEAEVRAEWKKKPKKSRKTCLRLQRRNGRRPLQGNRSNNDHSADLLLTYHGWAPFQAFLCIHSGTMPKPIFAHSILVGHCRQTLSEIQLGGDCSGLSFE